MSRSTTNKRPTRSRASKTGTRPVSPLWSGGIFKFVSGLIGGFVLTKIFQSLSGSALWLPVEWRHGIEILIALGVGTVSALFESLRNVLTRTKWFKRQPLLRGEHGLNASAAVSLLLLGAGIWLCTQLYLLRSESVHAFNETDDWWELHYGERRYTNILALEGKTDLAKNLRGIPTFMDKERSTIFLPLKFDDPMENYLVAVSEMDLGDSEAGRRKEALKLGFEKTLKREPMKLIVWSEGSGREYRDEYVMKFVRLHLLIMFSIAAAWGLFPQAADFLPDVAKDFFGLSRI